MSDAEVYGKYAEELIRFATVLVGPDAAADVVSASVITAFGAPAWLTSAIHAPICTGPSSTSLG